MSRRLHPLTLLLIVACGGGDPDDTDLGGGTLTTDPPVDKVEALSAWGEFGVGYTETSVTYDERTGGERTLRLATWYPTTAHGGISFKYLDVFEAPDVWLDAREAEGEHPIVVFSHGHQGYAENSAFLMAHLASHGFVVAAPDHTGNTSFDSPDRETEIYFQRQDDISAVLDHLEAGGRDVSRVVGIGHSFGGYTLHALLGARHDGAVMDGCADGTDETAFCSTWVDSHREIFTEGFRDERIVAGISMAAGDFRLFGHRGISRIATPLMIMAAELDGATADTAEPMWDVLSGDPNRYVYILGGGHQTYTDYAGFLDDGSTIDPAEGQRIVAAYGTAFALRHGPGDATVDGILDGSEPVSAEAELRR